MKTLILTLTLALVATTANAWYGIYNPYGTTRPQILGHNRNFTYQRYRPIRGHYGGYRAYSGNTDWYSQQRQTWALEGIERELQQQNSNRLIYGK